MVGPDGESPCVDIAQRVSTIGWVDFVTGIQVGAVVIDNAKKQFLKMFLEFVFWYSFEDLQKNALKMCKNSVVF